MAKGKSATSTSAATSKDKDSNSNNEWSTSKLDALSRRDLQSLAKKHGVKANATSDYIRQQLAPLLLPRVSTTATVAEAKTLNNKKKNDSDSDNDDDMEEEEEEDNDASDDDGEEEKDDDDDDDAADDDESGEEEEEEVVKPVKKSSSSKKTTVVAAPKSSPAITHYEQSTPAHAHVTSFQINVSAAGAPSSSSSSSISTSMNKAPSSPMMPSTPVIAVLPPSPLPTPYVMPSSPPTVAHALPSSPPNNTERDGKSPILSHQQSSCSPASASSSPLQTLSSSLQSLNDVSSSSSSSSSLLSSLSFGDRRRSRLSIGGATRRKWSISNVSLMTAGGDSVTVAAPAPSPSPSPCAATGSTAMTSVCDDIAAPSVATVAVGDAVTSLPTLSSLSTSTTSMTPSSAARWRSRSMGTALSSLDEEIHEISREVEAMARTPGRRRTIASSTPSRTQTHTIVTDAPIIASLDQPTCMTTCEDSNDDDHHDDQENRACGAVNVEHDVKEHTISPKCSAVDDTPSCVSSSSPSSLASLSDELLGKSTCDDNTSSSILRRSYGAGHGMKTPSRDRRRSSFGPLVPRSPPNATAAVSSSNGMPLEPLIPAVPRRSLAPIPSAPSAPSMSVSRVSLGSSSDMSVPVPSSSSSTRVTPRRPQPFDLKASLAKPTTWTMKKGAIQLLAGGVRKPSIATTASSTAIAKFSASSSVSTSANGNVMRDGVKTATRVFAARVDPRAKLATSSSQHKNARLLAARAKPGATTAATTTTTAIL